MYTSLNFPLFSSFPLEIQSMVMQACQPNDRICLSLANKNLYALAKRNQNGSLDDSDQGPLCGIIPEPERNIWQWRYGHRPKCHEMCWEASNKRREAEGLSRLTLKKCRTRSYGSDHCECFSRKYKLHSRLRSWMPKGLNYCGDCDKFTKRKRQHKGRCYHGCKKPRIYAGNFWTHRSGHGAFGRKLWKKWFNNRAMNSLEGRLERGSSDRAEGTRYTLRALEPKQVDTKAARDNNSMKFQYYA